MLTSEQILEIREHLETAQNPIFFFDNDPDGLCSFLILQRFIERGKGIPIKSFPKLIDDYFRKVVEFNADYIFILDKAEVSDKFWEKVKEVNIPVVWIDHHAFKFEDIPDFVNYYNSFDAKNNDSAGEPVTSLCYKATQKKDDVWLGVAGCIADKFVPEFYNDFSFLFPDKIIVIAYVSGYKANISGRGKNIRKIILEIIGGLEGATGGGHQDAVGAQVQIEDLEFFKKELKEKVGD